MHPKRTKEKTLPRVEPRTRRILKGRFTACRGGGFLTSGREEVSLIINNLLRIQGGSPENLSEIKGAKGGMFGLAKKKS